MIFIFGTTAYKLEITSNVGALPSPFDIIKVIAYLESSATLGMSITKITVGFHNEVSSRLALSVVIS